LFGHSEDVTRACALHILVQGYVSTPDYQGPHMTLTFSKEMKAEHQRLVDKGCVLPEVVAHAPDSNKLAAAAIHSKCAVIWDTYRAKVNAGVEVDSARAATNAQMKRLGLR
jgi:hypothetical protein